jgi:methylated-DNA-[protein]-cysteine S-methyltransferase
MLNIEQITNTRKVFQGPSLHVQVHYSQGAVESIHLSPSLDLSFLWSFFSDELDESLEASVDQWLTAYNQKQSSSVQIPFHWNKLPLFTVEALKMIEKISFGSVRTYGDIAARLNRPMSARAVGGACRRNPFPLLIPCHRVLDSKQGLRGYSAGGLSVKQSLLDFEKS